MSDSNKETAITFLKMSSNGKIEEAYSKFIGSEFCHHNPYFEGTAEALLAGMLENAQKNPDKIFEVKQAIAEDDRVVVHSHVCPKPGDRGAAVVHIFRFENGRIVELWDLGQPIPEESPNHHGMF